MSNSGQFSTCNLDDFSLVLADVRAGRAIVLVDDLDRENEGDLVLATELVTAEHLAFMMREARGLICVSISGECAARLDLPLQATHNRSRFGTAFTVSVNYRGVAGDGITAADRALTMQRLVAADAVASEFVAPGQVCPLIAHPQGVFGRRGQTEGSYDLARLVGLKASGVICEILDRDGELLRGIDLRRYADHHGIRITSITEIARYRSNVESYDDRLAMQELL